MNKGELIRMLWEKATKEHGLVGDAAKDFVKKGYEQVKKSKALKDEYGKVSTPDMEPPVIGGEFVPKDYGKVTVKDAPEQPLGKVSTPDMDALKKAQDPSMFDKGMDLLDRPGALMRSALQGIVRGEGVNQAGKTFTEPLGKSTAPSGYDVASEIGEKYGIESPAVLGTLATGIDLLDPSMVAGKLGAGLKAAKAANKSSRFSDLFKGLTSKSPKAKESMVKGAAKADSKIDELIESGADPEDIEKAMDQYRRFEEMAEKVKPEMQPKKMAVQGVDYATPKAERYRKLLQKAGMDLDEGPEHMQRMLDELPRMSDELKAGLMAPYGLGPEDIERVYKFKLDMAKRKLAGNLDIAGKDAARRVYRRSPAGKMESMLESDIEERLKRARQLADDPNNADEVAEKAQALKDEWLYGTEDTIPNMPMPSMKPTTKPPKVKPSHTPPKVEDYDELRKANKSIDDLYKTSKEDLGVFPDVRTKYFDDRSLPSKPAPEGSMGGPIKEYADDVLDQSRAPVGRMDKVSDVVGDSPEYHGLFETLEKNSPFDSMGLNDEQIKKYISNLSEVKYPKTPPTKEPLFKSGRLQEPPRDDIRSFEEFVDNLDYADDTGIFDKIKYNDLDAFDFKKKK
jgi:hypothetical protein